MTARRGQHAALPGTVVLGVETNVAFIRGVPRDPGDQADHHDAGLVERMALGTRTGSASDHEMSGAEEPDISRYFMTSANEALAAAALARVLAVEPAGPVTDPWDIPDGWRPGERAWTKFRLSHGPGTVTEVRVRGLASTGAEVAVGDGEPVTARASFRSPGGPGGDGPLPGGLAANGAVVDNRGQSTDLVLTYDGRTVRSAHAAVRGEHGAVTWLGRDGQAWAVRDEPPVPLRGARAGSADGTVRSPMPGTVLAVHVAVGDVVSAGQPVLVVEAMKMEHTVTAPFDGAVTELTAKAGQQVRMDETLAVIGSIAQKATIEAAESANEPGGQLQGPGPTIGSIA